MSRLSVVYSRRIEPGEVIFTSFSSLYDAYLGVLKSAQAKHIDLYEKARRSADTMQSDMSGQLHSQGFVLMTGAAEALLKDIFEDLIIENFTKINNVKDINFSVGFLQQVIKQSEQGEFVAIKLAEEVVRQLSSNQNTSEKINFQNIQSLKDVFSRFFQITIDIDTDLYNKIHVYWQKRHALVHSNGLVDKRYIHNVEKVGYTSESEGAQITISKTDYDEAKNDFCRMFDNLELLIEARDFSFAGVG